MHILGIDPGTGRTGWGVIKKWSGEKGSEVRVKDAPEIEYIAHGCIVTSQDYSMPERLFQLFDKMEALIETYKPDCVAIEHIFFGRNAKTAISVSQAKGVILLASARRKLPTFEYTGISVKHHLSGHGRTDKKDIQVIVRRLLNSNKKTLPFSAKDKGFDDAADALAIALHHAIKLSEELLSNGEKIVLTLEKTSPGNKTKKGVVKKKNAPKQRT